MTDAEYREAIYKILESGRGYDAIVTLGTHLRVRHDSDTSRMRERRTG